MEKLKQDLNRMIVKRELWIRSVKRDLDDYNMSRAISEQRKQSLRKQMEIDKEEIKVLESFLDQIAE